MAPYSSTFGFRPEIVRMQGLVLQQRWTGVAHIPASTHIVPQDASRPLMLTTSSVPSWLGIMWMNGAHGPDSRLALECQGTQANKRKVPRTVATNQCCKVRFLPVNCITSACSDQICPVHRCPSAAAIQCQCVSLRTMGRKTTVRMPCHGPGGASRAWVPSAVTEATIAFCPSSRLAGTVCHVLLIGSQR